MSLRYPPPWPFGGLGSVAGVCVHVDGVWAHVDECVDGMWVHVDGVWVCVVCVCLWRECGCLWMGVWMVCVSVDAVWMGSIIDGV